jgi:hypothetical protein
LASANINNANQAERLTLDIFQISSSELKRLDEQHLISKKHGMFQRIDLKILSHDKSSTQGVVYFYELADISDLAIVG